MLVERELAIRSFVPEDYLEVIASFRPVGGPRESRYQGTWFRPQPKHGGDKETLQQAMRLPVDGEEAARIIGRARAGTTAHPPRLPLPNHVHRLIILNRSARHLELAEPLLGVHAAFDRSVVLFQDVVQVLHRSVPAAAAKCPFLLYVREG